MSRTKILFVRHGETDWNLQRRVQGRSDIESNELGHRQNGELADRLAGMPIDRIYTSDLKRALDTARAVAASTGVRITSTADLRELDEGEWEGLTETLVETRWPDLWRDRRTARRPGGESPAEALARGVRFIEKAAGLHPDATIVAVTHQSMIRLVYETLGSADLDNVGNPRWPANAEVVAIEVSDGTLTDPPSDQVLP